MYIKGVYGQWVTYLRDSAVFVVGLCVAVFFWGCAFLIDVSWLSSRPTRGLKRVSHVVEWFSFAHAKLLTKYHVLDFLFFAYANALFAYMWHEPMRISSRFGRGESSKFKVAHQHTKNNHNKNSQIWPTVHANGRPLFSEVTNITLINRSFCHSWTGLNKIDFLPKVMTSYNSSTKQN